VKKFKKVPANLDASCVNRDGLSVIALQTVAIGVSMRRFRPGRAFLAGLLLLQADLAGAAESPFPLDSALRHLRDQDALLAGIVSRLSTANAALCDRQMPSSGAVLHAANQYSPALEQPVKTLFGFEAPLSVELVLPASPAAAAGLRANDGVLSVAGIAPTAEDGDGKPDTRVRDGFENRLIELPPAAPQVWRIRRGGRDLELVVTPQPACPVRFEIVPGNTLTARNDGVLVQLSARYFERLRADEVAVVVAHELAHGVLAHRRRLVAAGVSKGLLAEFGRNGRLNRAVEREADRLSVHLLRNAGYDPASAPQFWDRHGGELGGGILRSRVHDSPRDRAALMRLEIAAIPPGAPIPFLPPLLAARDQPLH
jgi:hypothetical protein